MATSTIVLSDPRLLAEYVPLEGFRGFAEQRLGVGPDLVAILIRDGKVVEASAGANIGIGGFWRSIKDALIGHHALRLIIADLKPFQLRTAIQAVTHDHVEVAGELAVEMQVNPERPVNILGLMREDLPLAKTDLIDRLAPHLGERVFAAAVARLDARNLRGNRELQDKLQADAMLEVERLAGDLGLLVRSVTLNLALNEEESAAIRNRAREREDERLELEARLLNRQIEREGESTVLELKTKLDVDKVRHASEHELRRLLLDQELAVVDARATAARIDDMKALQHRLDITNQERRDRLQAEIEAAEHLVALAKGRGLEQAAGLANDEALRRHQIVVARLRAEQREIERATEEADHRHRLALQRLEQTQDLELTALARSGQFRDLTELQKLQEASANAALDRELKAREAEHRRQIELQRQEAEALVARMSLMKDMPPDLVLAINAGLSKEVANVLVEQARAKAADGAEKMQLMRDMIDQAREVRIASEAQARHFFEQAMHGAAGVAHGAGGAAFNRQSNAAASPQDVECPACHRPVPAANRFCSACGQQMRT